MVPSSAEVVLFAINSAIKVGAKMRQAYVNSLKNKALALPLPDFDAQPNEQTATAFFDKEGEEGGQQFLERLPQLKTLYEDLKYANPTEAQREEYLSYYKTLYFSIPANGSELDSESAVQLLTIRQWQQGQNPNPTGLQLVAGSLIEIGVDYFNNVPGALNANSAHTKALKGFFQSLDGVSFSEGDLKATLMQEVAPQLFTTAIETLQELPAPTGADPKMQAFFESVTAGVANDLTNRLQQTGAPGDKEQLKGLGQSVFKSLVKHAGTEILSSPAQFLGTAEGSAGEQLVSSTGLALLDAITESGTDGLDLQAAFSGEGIDKVMGAALSVVAEHPDLVAQHAIVKSVVSGVSSSLAQGGVSRPDLVPELSRLLLEKSAPHLPQLLDAGEDGTPRNLLVGALQDVVSNLSADKGGQWKPSFTKEQWMSLSSDLLDEVVANPEWVTAHIGENTLLSETLHAAMTAIQSVPKGKRMNAATVDLIVKQSVMAVARRPQLLDKVANGEALLQHGVSSFLSLAYGEAGDARANWALVKTEALNSALTTLFNELALYPANLESVNAIMDTASKEIDNVNQNGPYTSGRFFNLANTVAQAVGKPSQATPAQPS